MTDDDLQKRIVKIVYDAFVAEGVDPLKVTITGIEYDEETGMLTVDYDTDP